jgi:uncharacterized membrane-anchored protein YitT (DUF2179 family)
VIFSAGLVFGWEASLFSMITLVVDGYVADYVMEGPSLIRIVTIITDKPESISGEIMARLGRGVTSWSAQGRYTGKSHEVLFVTVTRAQVAQVRDIVHDTDPLAFVVIGHGHVAYGSGFRRGRARAGILPQILPPVSDMISDVLSEGESSS